jgi:hypothetical protein
MLLPLTLKGEADKLYTCCCCGCLLLLLSDCDVTLLLLVAVWLLLVTFGTNGVTDVTTFGLTKLELLV